MNRGFLVPARLLLLLTVLGATSLQNAASDTGKEIYGTDDRLDVFEVTNTFHATLARSVCALVETKDLRANADGSFTLLHQENTQEGRFGGEIPMCSDERFARQPWVAFCTGFMVAEDLIATAGHCIDEMWMNEYRVVFGWEMIDATTPVTTVPANRVYRVVEEVHSANNFARDHAILRVDRRITAPGATPLPVRRTGRIADGALIGVIGHPMGLPKKVAFGANTRVHANNRPYVFYTNIDASGGNSGSPVFDQLTGLVEGIYVFSDVDDFLIDGNCFRLNRVEDSFAGQGVMRSATFARHIPASAGEEQKPLPICGALPAQDRSRLASDLIVALFASALLLWHARRPQQRKG